MIGILEMDDTYLLDKFVFTVRGRKMHLIAVFLVIVCYILVSIVNKRKVYICSSKVDLITSAIFNQSLVLFYTMLSVIIFWLIFNTYRSIAYEYGITAGVHLMDIVFRSIVTNRFIYLHSSLILVIFIAMFTSLNIITRPIESCVQTTVHHDMETLAVGVFCMTMLTYVFVKK